MENSREQYWKEYGINYAKKAYDDAYVAGYHNGRHEQREKWVNSEWIQIIPDKLNDIKLAAQDPCQNCVHRADYLKIGCNDNPKTCLLKQEQELAIEILTYFNKW